MWTDLGPAPGQDEIEVTVIGPGHGESVVVHLGSGSWLVVDSCTDNSGGRRGSAPLRYLREIGVDTRSAVKLVVVTHWDDDHVSGIADLLSACEAAEVCFGLSLTKREFARFIESSSIGTAATSGANVSEFGRVLRILHDRGRPIRAAVPGRTILGTPRVTSWSPSDEEMLTFLKFVAESQPKAGEPLRKAVPGSPNLTSVVLTVDWADVSVLLGADMENHADARRGWSAVVSEASRIGCKKSTFVKIPHHGSHSGHDVRMWRAMLEPNPISVIAPFGRGPIDKRPPKSSDVRRINTLSSRVFLTAKRGVGQSSKKDAAVARSLREGSIRLFGEKPPFGLVRSRRKPGGAWHHSLFGTARQAK